ncbi:hypothetical protein B0O99DRAFT_588944 [Bisporella sp. PMI_857]|nr:hypothetical protein B0O99DRAFT_588944 [Bisporella sp. PMI_857]
MFRFVTLLFLFPIVNCVSLTQGQSPLGQSSSQDHDTFDSERYSSSIVIDYSDPVKANASNQLLESIVAQFVDCRTIHELSVIGYPSLGNWTLLQTAIDILPKIETLYWTSQHPIPGTILRSLEHNHPSCRLYYTLPFNFRKDPFDPAYDVDLEWDPYDGEDPGYWRRKDLLKQRDLDLLPSIINSINLYSLVADIEYNSEDNLSDLELVFNTISSTPNLRELDLRLHTVGCLLGYSPFAFDFLSNSDVRFPPLEAVKISGYDFDERSDGGEVWLEKKSNWVGISNGTANKPQRRDHDSRTSLDVWLEIMDWSHLHTLELGSPSTTTIAKLKHVLPNVRHLSLRSGNWDWRASKEMNISKAITSFVQQQLQPLESFVLHNIKMDSWETFLGLESSSGSAWRNLESFYVGSDENINIIDNVALATLITTAPELRKLDVNVRRPGGEAWDDGEYGVFAAFPSLQNLTLRFPTPDDHLLNTAIYENETMLAEYHDLRRNYREFGDDSKLERPKIN